MESKSKAIGQDELNQILERTIGWINNCDTKTSIILSGLGVLYGIFLATDYLGKSISLVKWMIDNLSFGSVVYLIFISISVLLMLVGVAFFTLVLLSRTNISEFRNQKVNSVSLLFFDSISSFSTVKDYKNKIENCDGKLFIDDLISQIYVCSIICKSKFDYYKRGLLFSLFGVVMYCILNFIGVLVV